MTLSDARETVVCDIIIKEDHEETVIPKWSGRRESNPCDQLGKLRFYH